jgi:CBS domain-containing protein
METISHLRARDLLEQKPQRLFSVTPDATVYRALEVMAEAEVGALPVIEERKLVGIVSERDYARRIVLLGRKSPDTRVGEIMTKQVVSVSLETSLGDCMRLMNKHQIRHLPVFSESVVVGVITIGDVLRSVLFMQNQTIEELNRYVSGEPRVHPTVL